jgi:hypothetical protein
MDDNATDDQYTSQSDGNEGSAGKYAAIPLELRARPQWVNYKLVPKPDEPGKFDKRPYGAGTGGRASSTNHTTWSDFEAAVAAVDLYGFAGIGFVFVEDDPFAGLDLDGCRDPETGVILDWAQRFIDRCASYSEVSPSGKGVHVLMLGRVPPDGHKEPYEGSVVEMYDWGRYFTVTGQHLAGTPLTVEEGTDALQEIHDEVWGPAASSGGAGHRGKADGNGRFARPRFGPTRLPDNDVLERCRTDATGEVFRAIYDDGDLTGIDGDDSRADWLVWSKLVFYLGNDSDQIAFLAQLGRHYLHPENEAKAKEREEKWQREDANYGTFQRQQIAKILASKRADEIFSGGGIALGVEQPLHVLVDATVGELATVNAPSRGVPELFVRGGVLVDVRADEHNRLMVKELDEPQLKVEIDRTVRFVKTNAAGRRTRARPPQDVVQGVLGGDVLALPALAGIVETPVLRPDGTLLLAPGYDAQTRLIYRPEPGAPPIPPVPENPSDEDVRVAFALLHEVFVDFPFHSPADRANALGLLLTLPLRPAIRGNIPLGLIEAPAAGTGKGLLVDTIATIGIGHVAGTLTEVEDDAAWRKSITTALMTGRPFHIIDNVQTVLNSPQLAALLTSPEWRDRILGCNREVCIPRAQFGVWMATGNNVTLGGDLPRRCYKIRIDAREANPYLRPPERFKHHPLLEWVEQQRHLILHALLTICRAWFARGAQAQGAPTIGSFETWARIVWGCCSSTPEAPPSSATAKRSGNRVLPTPKSGKASSARWSCGSWSAPSLSRR